MGLFHLTKWYVDYVTASGDVYIGYRAILRLGLLPVRLSGNLTYVNGQSSTSTRIGMPGSDPTVQDRRLIWRDDVSGMRREWTGREPSIHRTLFDSPDGSIAWDCLMPSADVRMDTDAEPESSLGYAERLTMSVNPSQAGLRHLRWGRFVSRADSLVWIEWQGDHQLTLAFHNGAEQSVVSIGDDHVSCGNGVRLIWTDARPLRDGEIKASVFGTFSLARIFIPRSLQNIEEHKALARGRLCHGTSQSSEGWVIYEQVSFGG